MDKLMYLFFPLLFILILLHMHIMHNYIANTENSRSAYTHRNIWDLFAKLCVLFLSWLFHLPIFLLYILIYLSYCITFFQLLSESKSHFYFWINIHFINMILLHLTCLSAVSLLTGISLRDTYQNPILWLIVMILTLILMNLVEFLLMKKGMYEKIKILTNDTERFRQFIYFEWYAVVYLLFDSIPCMFQLPYAILSVFLIGSCIMLLIQVLLFSMYTYKIIEKAHYKAEYYRLEEERSDHIKKQMKLKKLAYIDSLTGTYTRRYAMEILESMQKDHQCVTVAYIDVNELKKVNDTLGHPEGDRYLIAIANSLNQGLFKNDVLARIGGDEFLIISSSVSKDELEMLLSGINQTLSTMKIGTFTPSFSFGIAEAQKGVPFDIDKLLSESDQLMYAYKVEFKKGKQFA